MALAGNILIGNAIRPSRRLGLSSTPTLPGPEGASQTFKKGAPLIYTSGYLVEAAVDPVAGIVGFAEEDAHNAAAGLYEIGVTPALPGVIFEGILTDESDAAYTLAQTALGLQYALQKDTTTLAWAIDSADTTLISVRIVELVDAIGTVNPRVRFTVLLDATIFGSAALA